MLLTLLETGVYRDERENDFGTRIARCLGIVTQRVCIRRKDGRRGWNAIAAWGALFASDFAFDVRSMATLAF